MAEPTSASELRNKPPQPDVDPNTKIPQSVLDQGTRAEAIQRSLTGEAEPSIATAAALEAPQEMQLDAPQQMVPQQPSPEDEQVSPEEWEQRYRRMKGRADTQREQLNQMGDIVQRLQTQVQQLQTVAPAEYPPGTSFVTEQEVNDYGPEFVDMVRRAAAEVAAPLQAEVQNLRGQLGTVQQETANAFLNRMNATIAGMVPNWQAINAHPRFVQWLGLPEVYSGVIRQQLMQDAWNNGDAHRVAAFFRAFLAEEAAVDPRGAGSNVQSPSSAPYSAPMPPVPRMSLDHLAAPGRAHSAAQMPADKPVYTAQDITRFYTEVAAGKWRTRDPERALIDADIIAAQREGRIIPDQRTIRPSERNGHW